jgi:5-methylcytosine-specific restriction endonuclease McrA
MSGKSAGRRGSRWRKLREEVKARGDNCYHDGQPIDYTLAWPHPDSFSVDHRLPLSKHPELAEDPGNLVASHLRCNQSKGAKEDLKLSLGNRSEDW